MTSEAVKRGRGRPRLYEEPANQVHLTMEKSTVQGLHAMLAEFSTGSDGQQTVREIKNLNDLMRYLLDRAVDDWRRRQPEYQRQIAARRRKLRKIVEAAAATTTDADFDCCMEKLREHLEKEA